MAERRTQALWFAAMVALAAPALAADAKKADSATPKRDLLTPPLGLISVPWPPDNPFSQAKWELGRSLYFDPRISADNSVSCATCHSPQFAFADAQPHSAGVRGQRGNRNAPTVINRAYSPGQFWDGRAATLEEQAIGPMENPVEMGHSHQGVVGKLKEIPGYRALFKTAFGSEEIHIDGVAKAIATFERTVLSGNSPYDRFKAGDKKAMTPAQIRGMKLFFNKAKCDQCHDGINFTTDKFHNIGVGMDQPDPDPGRYTVTKNHKDWGAFKTPTLREVASTPPYMHDGSLATLEEVVEFYNKGGIPNKNLDERIRPLHLNAQQMKDLVDFLKALSGEGWQHLGPPDKFPQ
jgi:cytochrome c peroxidase